MAQCAKCSKSVADDAVFTFDEDAFCDSCYVGDDDLGPLGDQFIACPKCSKRVHRFSIRCRHCKSAIRAVGKIEAAGRGSSTKGIILVVMTVALFMLTLFFIQRGFKIGAGGKSVGLGLLALALGLNGLFGTLYFRSIALVLPVKGIAGFAVGGISVILSVVFYILLI